MIVQAVQIVENVQVVIRIVRDDFNYLNGLNATIIYSHSTLMNYLNSRWEF